MNSTERFNMEFNIPRKVRFAIYVVTALGTPIVGYLFSKGIIGIEEVKLWGAEVTVAASMAAIKTTGPIDSK